MANLIKTTLAVHAHDCTDCSYCGSIADIGNDRYADIYYCPMDNSLIMRDGSEGPDYASFPVHIAEVVAARAPDWAMAYDLYERRPQ